MAQTPQNIRRNSTIDVACRERFLPLKEDSAVALRQLGLRLAGISDLSVRYEMGRPTMGEHLVLYTCAGRGHFWTHEHVRKLDKGSVLVVPAGTAHAYRLGGQRWQILWFHLSPTGAELGPAWSLHRAQYLVPLQQASEAYLLESHNTSALAQEAARRYAELITIYLRRELGLKSSELFQRFAQLWNDVDAKLAHRWTVRELAARFGASESHLYRLCIEHQGIAPLAQVTCLRMRRAAELLTATHYPLKQIAPLVGYENAFAFSTAFKRYSGSSPREFRANARGMG